MRPGPRNLITDVDGILVGNEEDHRLRSGVSVVLCERPSVASVDVRGGAPGTRETDLLEPHRTVERIDAVVLSGGSAFGLDAAGRDHHIIGRNADCGLHHTAIALHLAQCLPMSRFLPPLLPEY